MVREIAVFRRQEGRRGASLRRGVENLSSFALILDSVDAHAALTQRPEFGSFWKAVGLHLADRPEVRSVETAA